MQVFWGEQLCQAFYKSGQKKGQPCQNRAYYLFQDQLRCGTHSSKLDRSQLPKNPKAKELRQQELEARQAQVQQAYLENQALGLKGEIICEKLRMMKSPPYVQGFQIVLPNFKHQNHPDGFGCRSLSPKALGPIPHGMLGVPMALNLENFHQGAKVFPQELDSEGNPLPEALALRDQLYQDPEPHRHKFGKKLPNAPAFSVYLDAEGREHRYNYLECRYFYCHWYERLAKKTEDFQQLRKWVDEGVNLEIVGYDGYSLDPIFDQISQEWSLPERKGPIPERESNESEFNEREMEAVLAELMWRCYLDTSRPFGHELVLVTLLIVEKSENYPWNRFARENQGLYQGVI